MYKSKFYCESRFVPGPLKEQLKYSYYKDDNNRPIRVDQLQDFVFSHIKKKVSIQA